MGKPECLSQPENRSKAGVLMRCSYNRICLLACLALAMQGAPLEAQDASGTTPSIIQPERITLTASSPPITETYVCIEPCNLLTLYAPHKTIFHEAAPDAIGTFDTVETTKALYLMQDIPTTPLGTARLSEKAIGKDARTYPGWLWKGLLITLGCSILGLVISRFLPRKNGPDFSTIQLVAIFGPLVPFMMLLMALGFMSVMRTSVRDPKVDIYVDNATQSAYEILFNGEMVSLPSGCHICLNVRPRNHDLRVRKAGSGMETRFAATTAFREGETYVINLEQANRYNVEHKAYTLY